MELVYRNETKLFRWMLGWSLLIWSLLVLGTLGIALIYLAVGFLFYCFVQSALISYIKGNGVRITEEQFPDLKHQIAACCRKLGLDQEPETYLMQMGGMLNAFATRFLGSHFLVLYSDVVDGLADNPDALNFYIGHEIGHIKRRHLHWSAILAPALALPLIGPAYARAREYTCDRHGLAACDNPANAEHGLAVLAAGGKRARMMNHRAYVDQARQTDGFWMSFHELAGDYPWLVKRMAAVRALAAGHELRQPPRHKGAAVLALFVPRTGFGLGASIFVTVILVFVLSLVAALAVPAYQAYRERAQAMQEMAALHELMTRAPAEASEAADADLSPGDRASTPSDR